MRNFSITAVAFFLATSSARAGTLNPEPDEPAHLPPPANAAATADVAAPWTLGLAPRIGVVVPTSKLGAMMVGGFELDYALPAADHRLVIALDGSITQPSHDGSVMDPRIPGGSATYTIKETELATALLIDFRFSPPGDRVVPWVGAGPMLHMLRSTETTSFAPGDNTAQSTELGLELAGGVDYQLGPGFVAGDLRYAYSKLDHTLTGSTNAGKVTIAVGYRVVF